MCLSYSKIIEMRRQFYIFPIKYICYNFSKLLGYKVIIRSNQSPTNYAKNFIKRRIMAHFYKKADKIVVNSKDFKKNSKNFLTVIQ